MSNRPYDDRDYEPSDEMLTVASGCGRFVRRKDFTAFNMADYRSCENCSHMTAENRCALQMDRNLTEMR